MISKKEWFTLEELVQLNLPGLRHSKVTLHRKANKNNWEKRQRTGIKGVAYEYHISSLPKEAQEELKYSDAGLPNKLNVINRQTNNFPERLKNIIGNTSIHDFARNCNINTMTINQYLGGVIDPTLGDLLAMSHVARVSINWLATGIDETSQTGYLDPHLYVTVPDLNIKVAAGAGMHPIEESIGEFIFSKQWLQKEGLSTANLAIFHVQGDSMENTIHDGDIALVNVNESGWTGAINGIFILLVDDMLIIKRIEFDLIQKGIHVISDNPVYRPYFLKLNEENSTIKVLAKVERILTKPYQNQRL